METLLLASSQTRISMVGSQLPEAGSIALCMPLLVAAFRKVVGIMLNMHQTVSATGKPVDRGIIAAHGAIGPNSWATLSISCGRSY